MTKKKLIEKGYPENWEEISRRIKKRDEYTCQHCGAKQGQIKRGVRRSFKVVISAAHIDHKLINHDDNNLISLCQSCHYKYDNICRDFVLYYNTHKNFITRWSQLKKK